LEKLKKSFDPAEYYISRLSYFTTRIHATRKRLKLLAFFRLLIFLSTIILIVVATRWNMTAMIVIALAGVTSFLFTLMRYLSLQRQLRKDENLAAINENELKSLRGNFSMFDDGEEFVDPDHSYTSDLDIFGRLGLFQFLNRSATSLGKIRLADWLSSPLTHAEEICLRQEAVAEMSGKPGFRQEFLATGYLVKEQPSDKDDLLTWITEPASFSGKGFLFFLVFIPILTFTILALAIASVISPTWILLYLAVPFGFTGRYLKTITRKYGILSGKAEIMKKYSGLLSWIEKEDFASHKMKNLKKALHGKSRMPGEATHDLSAILDAFDVRNNILAGFLLNFLFLWDLVQVVRTERWQARYREELPRWLEVLAETDATCSLANFRFNHPGSIFPSISQDEKLLEAEQLGHPLIPDKNRVNNPAKILSRKHFTIITGANMAGKSTYLRTVGVNLVMAMAGSAVLAEKMAFQPAGLVTSIRTKDSLQKNESYFYAELKRLKYIIERLEAGEKLVILLDEILKGTNSRDKQSGSIALLEKLLRYEASGLIATHDLALGELEKPHPEKITNKSFEVVIENDALVFDYKLKDGVARQMNATFLMKKMGITD
jgi:hypothetical protein